jgi:hypothetical protein
LNYIPATQNIADRALSLTYIDDFVADRRITHAVEELEFFLAHALGTPDAFLPANPQDAEESFQQN